MENDSETDFLKENPWQAEYRELSKKEDGTIYFLILFFAIGFACGWFLNLDIVIEHKCIINSKALDNTSIN